MIPDNPATKHPIVSVLEQGVVLTRVQPIYPHIAIVNRIQGPASKLPHDGFERPSQCAFGPDGALYVTDFGEIDIAPERAGIRVQAGSGSLWRIRRVLSEPAGVAPPPPIEVPFHAAQYAAWAGLIAAAIAGAAWILRRLVRR